MSVEYSDYLKLRGSVALVSVGNTIEFFKTNTRDSTKVAINYEGMEELLLRFTGDRNLREICDSHKDIERETLKNFCGFLNSKNILINSDASYLPTVEKRFGRLIGLIEDYLPRKSLVIEALANLSTSKVMIVGMGAVGTWVAEGLARAGVKNFQLVDDDIVEPSNLHRQNFSNYQVAKKKASVTKERLLTLGAENVEIFDTKIDYDFFSEIPPGADLIINCADFPNVDITTDIVARYCMANGIPHIVGGGYNLHLTLVGQTIIPGLTACAKCFEIHMQAQNQDDIFGVKKLNRRNRKIGSFGPLTSLSASITTIDSIKVLIGAYEDLTNSNTRIEFRLNEMDFQRELIPKNLQCPWCGKDGIFSRNL